MSQDVTSLTTPEVIISTQDRIRGEYLMRRADMWTDLRSTVALPLGIAVALTDENFTVTAAAGGAMVTDSLDGRDARQGASLLGIETTSEGAVSDPKADKDLVNALMLGLIGRFARQRDFAGAAVVGANYVVTQRRDKRMDLNRKLVSLHELNKDELKAKTINKAKTAGQMAAIETLISPAAKDRRIRLGALAALSAGTALGWLGERQYRKRVASLIALKGLHPAALDSSAA